MEAALKQFADEVHVKPENLQELDLDDQQIHELTESDMKALSKCHNLVRLSIGDNGLKKVNANFPSLPKLTMLDLRGNDLNSDVLGSISRLTNLSVLMLTHNQIKTLDKFSNLKGLTHLQFLGLEGCPVTENHPDYRKTLFELLPSLEIVDFVDKEGNEIERPEEEEEDEGNLADFYNKEYSDDEEDEEYEGDEEEPEDEELEEDAEEEDQPPTKKHKP